MNIKIHKIVLVLFVFVSSASFAQHKFDIGVKVSTYDMERLQLEGRYHFDSPYSLLVNVSRGSRDYDSYYQTPVYDDSLIDISSVNYNASNVALKLGVQRKLGFLASDVFYAGAILGFGLENQEDRSYSGTYIVDPTINNGLYQVIDANALNNPANLKRTQSINVQLGVTFGMDVPLTQRLSINAELGFTTLYQQSLNAQNSFFSQNLYISGGLRYAFGKRG